MLPDLMSFIDKIDFSQFLPFIPFPSIGVGGGIEAKEHIEFIPTLKSTMVFLLGLGAFFGAGLALAAKRFSVKVDPRIEMVRDVLAGAQCGACGFAGCQSYAEAVVTDPNVSPNLCTPGKTATAEAVATITGKKMTVMEPKIARVFCQGSKDKAARKFIYEGIKDCRAAVLAGGGDKTCIYGCLGYGTCASVCPFDAIAMSEEGLPVINPEKCTACYTCANACPKKIIEILPSNKAVLVRCRSVDKGPAVKRYCQVGCIGCGVCEKVCPFDAAKVQDNLSGIDISKCMVCGLCVKKCPTNAILDAIPFRSKAFVTDKCIGCGRCALVCPVNAASGAKKEKHQIDQTRCIGCGICTVKCPVTAITGTFNYEQVLKDTEAKKAEKASKAAVNNVSSTTEAC
ncbi:MAG TPA: Fe-S cluster domain-containing protein [Thermodesulfovibrionia bacterium]|nr:Fe-S cluster domain-containing protein [Thermodesulfovibrionia bacterium]